MQCALREVVPGDVRPDPTNSSASAVDDLRGFHLEVALDDAEVERAIRLVWTDHVVAHLHLGHEPEDDAIHDGDSARLGGRVGLGMSSFRVSRSLSVPVRSPSSPQPMLMKPPSTRSSEE